MNANPSLVDLGDFQSRSLRIYKARERAREDFQTQGLAEADAEHDYRKQKAAALLAYRNHSKGVTEAEILAEGDVADHRKARDRAHVLRKSAEFRIAELERNAASLRTEATLSEDI